MSSPWVSRFKSGDKRIRLDAYIIFKIFQFLKFNITGQGLHKVGSFGAYKGKKARGLIGTPQYTRVSNKHWLIKTEI